MELKFILYISAACCQILTQTFLFAECDTFFLFLFLLAGIEVGAQLNAMLSHPLWKQPH